LCYTPIHTCTTPHHTQNKTYYILGIESAEAFSSFLLFFRLEIVKN
jgi:hypothetical protein